MSSLKNNRSFEFFKVDVDHHIAEIYMAEPTSRNSLGEIFWREFPELLRYINEDPAIRVAIIYGEGPHFCSGIDTKFISRVFNSTGMEPARARDRISTSIRQLQDQFLQLERLRVPVIAAIQGACIGAGLELACTADIRLCVRDAFFQLMEVQLGTIADLGGLQRLSKQLPYGLARELAYTGRRFSAEEAMRWGFVNANYEDWQTMQQGARKLAENIAAHSPLAVKYAKESLVADESAEIERALRQAATLQVAFGIGEDFNTALTAIQQRKKPRFDPLIADLPSRLSD